jgi:C4-dicarboxylate-specific signal transduction histidine kinase
VGLAGYLALVHPDDRERMEAAIRRTLAEGEELQEEYRMFGPDANERWFNVQGRVEYDDRGQPLRIRGVSADITARKSLEAEALRHRNQLARAQRVLALGQLSSALAHELNQPLGAILRNAEAGENFLRQDPPDLAEVREILADIRKDDQRAAAVIERMRALLQQRPLRLESITPRELAQQAAATLETEIRARHVTLSLEAPVDLPKVRGDRIHLQQVLINLLLNSLDALSNATEHRRHIAIQAERSKDDIVVFSVEDNGDGFDPDRLSDLFVPYYTTKADGIGLGLSISKTIIEAHGGRIHAENTPSGVARVWFSLPVAKEEDAT